VLSLAESRGFRSALTTVPRAKAITNAAWIDARDVILDEVARLIDDH